jgi:outer membrane protein assembly factor BamB
MAAPMRRSLFVGFAGAFAAAVFVTLASCGGDEDQPSRPTKEAGADTALLGNDGAPPEPDAEPSPGDVCGNGAGFEEGAPWPLRGGCTTRAGWSALPGPTAGQVSFSVPAAVGESSPAVSSAALVWVGTTDGLVLTMTSEGSVPFAHRTGGAVKSSPAIDVAGHAIIGSTDGFLYSISPERGPRDKDAGTDGGPNYPPALVVFKLAVGPIASSPVIGADGTIYVGTTDGKLVAVAGDGSAILWSATTNDTVGSSPAIGQDGTIYVGSSDGKLYALASDGTSRWALDLGSPIHGSPAVGGEGTVYIGSSDGKLHAVSAAGSERWAYATGGAIAGTPAVYAGSVYVGSEDRKLHAVSTLSGTARWTYDTLGAVGTPVIGPDGTVYVGSTDARLYAIKSTGTLFYAVNVKGAVKSAPAIGAGPSLYVTTENALVAVSP